ncbi:MAG: hypothetical protein HOI84_00295 [Flavobacteriaceae bacterium]|nr:hypothetical protein [Flavobacteriaceae bacterium]
MKRTALFFGSFNPIHLGHLHVARSALNTKKLTKWSLLLVLKTHSKEKLTFFLKVNVSI